MPIRHALIAALAALACACADAHAAGFVESEDRDLLEYTGDDGPNRITITERSEDGRRLVVVRDAVGTLEAGERCFAVDPHEAHCPFPHTARPYTALSGLAGDDAFRLDFKAGYVRIDSGAGDDTVDTRRVVDAIVSGGDGDDVLRGGPVADVARGRSLREENTLYGDDGADRLIAGDLNNDLVGGAGPDRLQGGAGPDLLIVDGDDLFVDAGAGDDYISGEGRPGMPMAASLRCGAGRDSVTPTLGRSSALRPGPLLRTECERLANFAAHPVRVDSSGITFRVRCLEGEFEYADFRCDARLLLRRRGRLLGARSFSARNAAAVELTFPLTPPLRRALSRRAVVELSLIDWEYRESDFGEFDERGNYHWRVMLHPGVTFVSLLG